MEANYILATLLEPDWLLTLTQAQWGQLIRQGKWTGLLARLHAIIEERGLLSEIPGRARAHLIAARTVADSQGQVLRWEVNRIERAFKDAALPFLLLKGAAYILLDLPFARGRVSSDVDILVAKDRLIEAERCLIDWGWAATKLEEYDQYFYRAYSHELPPLRHRERGTIVDVHHTILPPTGRLHPDPVKLMTGAVQIPGTNLSVLAPTDMVLHSAAHAFQDGDLKAPLRDLVDLDGLFRHFGTELRFWQQLLPRASELQLSRPLYYALRYTKHVLNTPIPEEILDDSQKSQPPWPALRIMDQLVANVVRPRPRSGEGFAGGFSAGLLYARSHWLRMPPWLLTRHLLRKSLRLGFRQDRKS